MYILCISLTSTLFFTILFEKLVYLKTGKIAIATTSRICPSVANVPSAHTHKSDSQKRNGLMQTDNSNSVLIIKAYQYNYLFKIIKGIIIFFSYLK